MSNRLSDRVQRLGASATLRLAAQAAQLKAAGQDVLSFGLGEPDFDTPLVARDAAKAAIDAGHTHYTANNGIPALREAIADALRAEQGLAYDPGSEVLVTNGSKQAIAQALLALVNEGDEVLVPSPYWVTYPELVTLCDGVTRLVPTHANNGFHLTAADLSAACTPRSRVLILNSPNNPTGAVFDRGDLVGLARVIIERDLTVVSDEIYGHLVYGDRRHVSPAAVAEGMRERTILCSGASKAFAMTGWRIGYAAGPTEVIGAMARIQSHVTSNACSISQYAAVAAFRDAMAEIGPMREEFDRRRHAVVAALESIPGVSLGEPEGAFYAFPRVGELFGRTSPGGIAIRDSASFCEALLSEALVALVPGAAFGADDCMRLSYAASMESLTEGCARIGRFVTSLT